MSDDRALPKAGSRRAIMGRCSSGEALEARAKICEGHSRLMGHRQEVLLNGFNAHPAQDPLPALAKETRYLLGALYGFADRRPLGL